MVQPCWEDTKDGGWYCGPCWEAYDDDEPPVVGGEVPDHTVPVMSVNARTKLTLSSGTVAVVKKQPLKKKTNNQRLKESGVSLFHLQLDAQLVVAASRDASGPNADNPWCQPILIDPLTQVWSFLLNPGPLRAACSSMVDCYSNSVYLEMPQPCPYYTVLAQHGDDEGEDGEEEDNTNEIDLAPRERNHHVPILWTNLKNLGDYYPQHRISNLHLVDIPSTPAWLGPDEFTRQRFYWKSSDVGGCFVLARLPTLASLGGSVVRHWSFIREVVLEDLPAVARIGANCLSNCTILRRAALRHLPQLQAIGNGFLADNPRLVEVSLEDLPKLDVVGTDWLAKCEGLKVLQLRALPALETIGGGWLSGCTSLQEVSLENLPQLREIGPQWLHESSCHPNAVKMSGLPKFKDTRNVKCSTVNNNPTHVTE